MSSAYEIINRLSLDPVHDQIGTPVIGFSGINNPRNGRVLEVRQVLSFLQEPLDKALGIAIQNLDGNRLLKGVVAARAFVDLRGTALINDGLNPIGSDSRPDKVGFLVRQRTTAGDEQTIEALPWRFSLIRSMSLSRSHGAHYSHCRVIQREKIRS